MTMTVWEEFGITTDDRWDDPKQFAQRVADMCSAIKVDITSVNNIGGMKKAFIEKSELNIESRLIAKTFVDEVIAQMSELEPEDIVNILPQLKRIEEAAQNIIIGAAMRNTTRKYSRKRAIAMYRRLRDAYNLYVNSMCNLMDDPPTFPIVPALTGNYTDSQLMGDAKREFIFSVDGEPYLNYYHVANLLGIEFVTMMDLIDAITKSDGTINGKTIELLEL